MRYVLQVEGTASASSNIICLAYLISLEDLSSVAFGARVVEYHGTGYVLHAVLMARPEQASSLQGSHDVSCDNLAANGLWMVSSWQQGMENYALLAVLGQWARRECSDPLPCRTGAAPFIFYLSGEYRLITLAFAANMLCETK